jgi:hypothetical protein
MALVRRQGVRHSGDVWRNVVRVVDGHGQETVPGGCDGRDKM